MKILVTGGAVYGEPEYLPCNETHPINPICQYGATNIILTLYRHILYQNKRFNYNSKYILEGRQRWDVI